MLYKNIIKTIGNTPLVYLSRYEFSKDDGTISSGNIYAKIEGKNPGGSIKDRTALYMIEDAEKKGLLKKGSVMIEPTSGNTGIGLALVAGAKGYKTILVMPDSMSRERRDLLSAYGAELYLTEGTRGMRGAIEKAENLASETRGAFMPGQFTNKANPKAHFETTGPEIWKDSGGKVDILVSGVGTGGTITGAGRFLKNKNPAVKIVAVEPKKSNVLTGGTSGAHGIQGIGAGFIPDILDRSVISEVMKVSDEDAFDTAKKLAKTEGILAGISSGAALYAASVLASKKENKDKNIIVILPDTGERYLSSGIFDL
ncbi:MAG TPA: cysteine synthase A [Bacillota bacterium]|nr:cysteine synthase A [Bacillota bacterium]